MEISYTSLMVLAQIVPVLLLASYFDKEALNKIRTYSNFTRYSWMMIILIIVLGEYLAITAIIEGSGVDGLRGTIVHLAVMFALFNLLTVAAWRIVDYDLASGMPKKLKRKKKK